MLTQACSSFTVTPVVTRHLPVQLLVIQAVPLLLDAEMAVETLLLPVQLLLAVEMAAETLLLPVQLLLAAVQLLLAAVLQPLLAVHQLLLTAVLLHAAAPRSATASATC